MVIINKLLGNNTIMELDGDNKIIIGEDCLLENTSIIFRGRNNILKMGGRCHVKNSQIEFKGNGSLVWLSNSKYDYYLSLLLFNNSVFYMGRDNYINHYNNGKLLVFLAEQKHVFFGNGSVISFDICMRTADPHLIYNIDNKERINPSRSIFVGDRVWLGQSVLILKGTQIGSGSIIGAGSVVSGKTIPSNTAWAGNPARQKKDGVFWSGQCVNNWQDKETQMHQIMKTDRFVFEYRPEELCSFNQIEHELSVRNLNDKMAYLYSIECNKRKNRFFC